MLAVGCSSTKVRNCSIAAGLNFGYYYGPYLYWGPPVASYRGHRRGRRIEGHRHRRGYLNRLPGFRSGDARPRNRVNRPRVTGDRRPGLRAGNRRPRLQGNRVPGFRAGQFRQPRANNRGRIQGNRQFRQFRGNGQRQMRRRKDSALPATMVMTSFKGWSTEIIGTMPVRVA